MKCDVKMYKEINRKPSTSKTLTSLHVFVHPAQQSLFMCTYLHVQIKESFNYLKMFSCVLIKWSFISIDVIHQG